MAKNNKARIRVTPSASVTITDVSRPGWFLGRLQLQVSNPPLYSNSQPATPQNIDLENGQSLLISSSYVNRYALGINDRWTGTEAPSSLLVDGNLKNLGTINIDTSNSHGDGASGGSSVSIVGTLINNGTLTIGNENLGAGLASPLETTVSASALVNTGAIIIEGSGSNQAELLLGSAAPRTLATFVHLYGDALLQYGSGGIKTITSTGTLLLEGATGPNLSVFGGHTGGGSGPQALPQLQIAGEAGQDSALSFLTRNDGHFQIDYDVTFATGPGINFTNTGLLGIDDSEFGPVDGARMSFGGNLINSGSISVDTSNDNYGAAGNGSLSVAGTLVNNGLLSIGNDNLGSGTSGTLETEVTAAALVGTGSISIDGSASNQAELLAGSAAPEKLSMSIDLYGDALLQFVSGDIRTITSAGSILLEAATGPNLSVFGGHPGGGSTPQAVPQIQIAGQTGQDSALYDLTRNDGQFQIEYDVSFATGLGVNFTNTGLLGIDNNEFGPVDGASMSFGGNLLNSGTINVDTSNDSFGSAGDGSLSVAGTLVNDGSLSIGSDNLGSGASGTPETEVSVAALVDAGSVTIEGSANDQAELVIGSAAPEKLATSINLYGDALMQFGSGDIETITKTGSLLLEAATGPNLSVFGGHPGGGSAPQAVPQLQIAGQTEPESALALLTSNSGQFQIEYDVTFATGAVSFTNTGMIGIDNNEFGPVAGASMSFGGNLINNGSIYLDTNDNPFGAAGNGSLSVDGMLKNSGNIQVGSANLGKGVSSPVDTNVTVASFTNSLGAQIDLHGSANAGVNFLANAASTNFGILSISTFSTLTTKAFSNSGTLVVAGGTVDLNGKVTGSGTISIDGGQASIATAVVSTQIMSFLPGSSDGTLAFDATGTIGATVDGFDQGNVIDLSNFSYNESLTSVSWVQSSSSLGTLSVHDGIGDTGVFQLDGTYSSAGFSVETDGAHGTVILYAPPS